MRIVIDTNVLVAALRSPSGASAEIVRRVLMGRVTAVCSVPLFLEYEAVLMRAEHLRAAGADAHIVANVLDVLAGAIEPVEVQFLWRPQLRDPTDDMVLEAAVNGRASVIVSSNGRDFEPEIGRFGIVILKPGDFLKGVH